MSIRRLAFAGCIALTLAPCASDAQVALSLDLAGARVTYEGFLTSNAVTVAPTYSLSTSRGRALGSGVVTFFESGSKSGLVSLDGLYRAVRRPGMALEARGSGGASWYTFADPSLELFGGARLAKWWRRSGVWAGADRGGLIGRSSEAIGVGRGDVGAWWRRSGLTARLNAMGTAMDTIDFGDVTGDLSWRLPRAELAVTGGFRISRDLGPTTSFAAATGRVRIARGVELSAAYGKALPGLLRFSPGSRYASIGVRIGSTAILPSRYVLDTTARSNASMSLASIFRFRDTVVVLIRARSADRVELSGDFTDWEPRTLVRDAEGQWRGSFVLPPGLYRFNVRVNGGDWAVPEGAGRVRDDFGGDVAVFVVRPPTE